MAPPLHHHGGGNAEGYKGYLNLKHPGTLTQRKTDILKDGFEAIRRLQDRMRGEFTGDVI